jgi:polysaccharide export outer membrane protein
MATDVPGSKAVDRVPASRAYVLGPEDTLQIHVLDVDTIGTAPYPIDLDGNLELPRIGRVHAAGLTIPQLEAVLVRRFHEYLRNPAVTVSVAEFHSQPILILGEVASPGVHQIRGRKTLLEAISEAGGLKADAGDVIKITRKRQAGSLPLPNSSPDGSGEFLTASVDVHAVMEAQRPEDNIAVDPGDVITVPKAELVYVIGAVNKSGGFVLSERASISVLEALSMAEGLQHTASSTKSKILRPSKDGSSRAEIPVDVKGILQGKRQDIPLMANDILFIPNSAAKTVSLRAIEAAVQAGSGLAIYGHL